MEGEDFGQSKYVFCSNPASKTHHQLVSRRDTITTNTQQCRAQPTHSDTFSHIQTTDAASVKRQQPGGSPSLGSNNMLLYLLSVNCNAKGDHGALWTGKCHTVYHMMWSILHCPGQHRGWLCLSQISVRPWEIPSIKYVQIQYYTLLATV